MDDSCAVRAVCAESLEWVAYGSSGHREVCSTCVVRLRFVLEDRRRCICKTESPTVFITKVFISEQKLYTRPQLNQHIGTGDSEVDGSESERGGFMGHPVCEFCRNLFYRDNELYMHMSRERCTCQICQRQHPGQYDCFRNYDDLETHFRQEHFLCEDEACLAKLFIVFQAEAETKRHNTIEHGGHMSRSQRNAALQYLPNPVTDIERPPHSNL